MLHRQTHYKKVQEQRENKKDIYSRNTIKTLPGLLLWNVQPECIGKPLLVSAPTQDFD